MERIRRFFKKLRKTIGAKGYTLLEVAAVVAVTGTLAAVAMPVVADKIAAGKLVAAQSEVQSIRDSILNFIKDTGVPPFYATGWPNLSLPPENVSTFCHHLVTKDGVDPQITGTGWPTLPTIYEYQTLDGQLINNTPAYPTMGISAWKGPYIPSLKKDPWGNRYLVTIKWLAEPVSGFEVASGIKAQKAVFVISAGPNGIIETNFSQVVKFIEGSGKTPPAGFVLGVDDIVARIQ